MAIFDNELIDNTSSPEPIQGPGPKEFLGSIDTMKVDTSMGGFENFASNTQPPGKTGLGIKELSNLNIRTDNSSFSSPFQMVTNKELSQNKRYDMYERDVNLENIQGLNQGWASQLANGVVKMGATAVGTFAQGFATIPNTVSSIKNGSITALSGDPDGYEGTIDNWLKNIEDYFPNYYSDKEKDHPYLAAIPFAPGSANFWGDKVIKNLGFTVGAIGSAVVQDLAIGAVTGGVGEIPLVAAQVGKASLWLNKLFAGSAKLDRVLDIARGLGKTEQQIFNIKSLAQAAAATKLSNGFRYGMNVYGSARTEAGVEARDGYRQVRQQLLDQYKIDNLGAEPTGADAQEIEDYATDSMNTRFGLNMAILTVSNAIQFDNLFKSFTNAGGGITGGLTKDLQGAGKLGLKEGSLDVFERKAATGIGGKVWEFVEPKIPNILSEGVYEEGGQYAVEKGTYDYYTRKYTNLKDPNNKKNWDSLNEVMTSTSKGLAEQFGSSEGIENMFVGALSALITGGIMGKIDQVKGQGKEARLQSAINSLNQYGLTGILQDKYTDTLNSVGIAEQMNAAAKSGNVYAYKNLKHDLFFNFVNSRIPSGQHETTIEQLKLLKDLPKEEFEKTFGMDFGSSNKKTVDEYVDGLINQANIIKDTNDILDSTYKNPFKQIVNPKTKEEAIETTNHFRFNNWKTELGYNLSVIPDANSRLASIEQDVANINPLLDNALLSKLTKKDSLQELAKTYEEKANQLSKTITDYTTAENRKATKEQIKALRTQSEKINLAINNKDYNSKTFDDLLNFELNNQDSSKARVVGAEHSTNLFNYGFDINKLNNLKQATSEIFDNLTSKEGFEKFFAQAEDIANEKTPDVETEDVAAEQPTVVPTTSPQFTNKAGVKESIDLNREYQVPTSKIARIDKIADDRWQVTAPNGDVTFHTTEGKAKEIADELNSDFADLGKVKVLSINEDGTIKVEDLSGNIQNIAPELLSGYERIQTEQEKLQKIAEEIAKQQDTLLNKSGVVGTGNDLQDLADQPKESPKKSARTLYISGTTTSEKDTDPHVTRSREFLNNSADFKNRSNLRAILVTPNNEASLGLSGLAKLSYGDLDMSQSTDVNLGFVAQVFIEQVGGKSYFVNKEGKQIGEVGKQVDLNDVIFQTMPTTELTFLNGDPRYRSGEKAEAEAQAKSWGAFREGLFNAEQGTFIPYTFVVSRGIAIENKVNEEKERNHVAGVLIDSKEEGKTLRNEQLIQISTTGTIEHHGELINFPKGRPVLQHGDTLQFLNNRIFTSDEAQAIFEVIKNLSNIIVSDNKIDNTYASFLQNVLYWRKGATEKGTNQIRIDTANMTISLGGTSYDISDIANKEKEIVDQLKTTYNNVNNTTLKEGLNDKFLEFYMKDGKLVDNEWDNYQSYLLSSKFPNGTARPIGETPLSTAVSKPTEAVPYSYKSKYATLQGVELPVQVVAPAAPSAFPTIGGYELDGTTEHEFKLAKAANGDERIVSFTGTVDANGDISVKVIGNDLTTSIAANKDVVINVVIPALTVAGKYDATRSDEQLVTDLLANQITADLLSKKAAAPVVVTTPEVVTDVNDSTKPASFNAADATGPSDEYRRVGKSEKKMMSDAEIQLFKQWAAENVPFIPYEILDNIITTFDGEKAWGVFENGVAKFYKGGLRGTEYHEIFEAIYKGMLSPEQQRALLEEFKAKSGTFLDRETGKKIDYAKATDKQAKERIADDFADFRLGKLPARSLSEKILNFFRSIIDFVKSFVNKPSLKQDLFKAINTGEFKERTLNESVKNEAAEYRAIEGLTEQKTHEFVQDMTARAAGIIFGGSKKSIYDIEKLMSADVFNRIEAAYIKENKRQQLGETAWKELIEKTKTSLRVLGIRFNEEDKININDENVNKNDYAPDAFSVDWKKSAPFAIKFAVGTLPMTEATNQENSFGLELPKRKGTSVKGLALLNYTRAFATLINKLANTTKVTKVVDKLINLAKFDSNYVRLFQRVGGKLSDENGKPIINFSEFKKEDWRLFIEFTQTFTKQNPDAIIQYITGDEVYMGSANLNKITDEVKRSWTENIKALSTDKDSLIIRDGRVYKVKDLSNIPIKTPQEQVAFLTSLGIEFPLEVYNRLKTEGKDNQQKQFGNAVSSIREYLKEAKDIMSVRGKTLGINGQLNTLAELLVKVTNPNQDSTYRNVEDKQANSYTENNAPSLFENEFNESNTLEELLETRPELKDVFSKHSIVLSKGGLFIDKDGNKFKDFKVSYIQGTKIVDDNKGVSTSNLTLGNRLTQEINQNLSGNYYVLIPADGSTEWMMNLGNNIQFKDVESGRAQAKINTIFKGYLFDDVALALDASNRKQLKNVGDKATELRFFKDILSEKTLLGINTLITNNATQEQIEEYINTNIEDVNASVKTFIDNQVNATRDLLIKNGEIKQVGENKFVYPKLSDDFAKDRNVNLNKKKLSADDVTNLLTFARANYVISNIELHKILFGDPYQFAIKDSKGKIILDETKRIKSFLSPARTTFDTPEYNTFLNDEYNNVNEEGTLALEPTDPGYHQHKPYVNTFTAKDVEIEGKLMGKTNEADAASWIMDGTYREVLLKNHQWDDKAEAWHQYQMSYMRSTLARKGEYKYTNDKLKDHDVKTLSRPEPIHVTYILKPIARGNKYNKSNVDLVLDKFSQMPVYYSMVEGTNLEKLYLKMMKEGFGYAIMESGRKVGIEEMQPLYNKNGSFNEEAFNNKIQVPWKAYGIQVETVYESDKEQTRGSQITKIASMDLFSDGVGSEAAIKEYTRNTEILDRLTRNGYKTLLQKLGVEDLGDGFRIIDRVTLSETLRSEMMRRELADNVVDSITLDENGEFIVPFEASPAYIQIRNILYSIVDKSIRSPKMNGGGYVQAPVTMWENAKEGRKIAIATENGYKQISKEEFEKLSNADKAKVVLTDDTLKFYTKEDPYCEIMLPHWFKNKLNKGKFKTDKQLLDYLNKTEEGKSILRGIGFRIPTQSLSSTETFRVKGFLPQAMGKTVIVPSEITTKAGSDFDIDKLNLYLKSVYIDKNGDIKLVSLKGSEQANNEFYGDVFDSVLADKKIKKSELQEAADIRQYGLEDPNNLLGRYGNLLDALLEDVEDESDLADSITKQLEKLGDVDLQASLKDKFVKEMYKRALENEYYDSLEKLITLPENFNRLVSPVNDAGLGKLADKLDVLRGDNESLIKNRILDANYLTKLRHAFVTAKKWIGIAAVNITNHSLTQKTKVYMDVSKFNALKDTDRLFLGDGAIALPHNTVMIDGKEYVSLSGRFDATGKFYISEGLSGYATAFVDVAKDPYILKIIGSNLSVGTFMFLQRIGVPLETAAMFMNQPIIKEYLDLLDSKNVNNLFDTRNIALIADKFPAIPSVINKTSIALDAFEDNIKNYYSGKKINDAEQRVILQEFLKYAKMAEYNYKLSQATNYDTTKFRSGDSLFLKQTRTKAARESNIFSSVDNILDSTFIGEQAATLDLSMEAMGQILKLEQPEFSIITDDVLTPYAENQFLGRDNFEKIATKLKASFLDFIIQTNSSLADRLDELLKDDRTSVANQLAVAKKNHPEVKILNDLEIVSSDRIGGAKSVKLIVNTKSAYDENLYTGMMREMRDNPATNELYNSLVNLAILQGTYQSAISIRNIIPIEDYSAIISPIVSSLVADDTLAAFADANLFQKNNWNDSDVVPVFEPKFKPTQDFPVGEDVNGNDVYQYFNNLQFPNIEALGLKSTDRRILELNSRYFGKYTQADVLTVPRVITTEEGDKVDITTGLSITGADYIQRKNRGDLSLLDKFGYQKVKDALGEPLSYFNDKGDEVFIYKLVNLYGDGQYASENRTDGKPSVFNNGSVKVENEMPDVDIVNYYTGKVVEKVVPLAVAEPVMNNEEKTPIEGLTERLDKYGYAEVVLSSDFNEGPRPKGRLNSFKSSIISVSNNIQILADLNLNEFDFINEEDKKRLNTLRSLAEELREMNTSDISSTDRRTVAVEKRFAQLTNQLANTFVDIIGKHVEEQLGKKISSSKPTQAVTEEVKTPEVPAYEVNKELKNADGSKRFASTDGKKITINPVTSPEEFFDYLEGKEGGVTSQQKAKVLQSLAGAGWSMDNIKSILSTNKLINTFLVLHEQNHIDSNDKDVYWKNGKDLLTEDKIEIEVRATIDALEKLGGKPNTIELGNEEDPFTC